MGSKLPVISPKLAISPVCWLPELFHGSSAQSHQLPPYSLLAPQWMGPAASHTVCLRSSISTNTFYLLLLALWNSFLRLQHLRMADAASMARAWKQKADTCCSLLMRVFGVTPVLADSPEHLLWAFSRSPLGCLLPRANSNWINTLPITTI